VEIAEPVSKVDEEIEMSEQVIPKEGTDEEEVIKADKSMKKRERNLEDYFQAKMCGK